jgi:adenine-specific DNA-methyltransferase
MPRKQAPATSSPAPVEAYTHDAATRRNIPTAEMESVVAKDQRAAYEVRYPRNADLDPQIVWRGKDQQDWRDLVVHAPPLYIQEKVNPKALIDDLLHHSRQQEHAAGERMADLFADFDGIPHEADKTEFYAHDQNWTNRMILGDSLAVMASLAEREGLRGKVQCIYFDPPYGIKFNSNFQWSTTSKKVEEGKAEHITREPEQVKAFRDTWRDGIHSYLTYLRDRLTAARDLLTDSGSIFVQIGDENVHRVRALMDEVFGADNAGDLLLVKKKGGQKGRFPEAVNDYIVWFFKNKASAKAKQLYEEFLDESEVARDFRMVRLPSGEDTSISAIAKLEGNGSLLKTKPLTLQRERGCRLFKSENSTSGGYRKNQSALFEFNGRTFDPGLKKGNCWKHTAIDAKGELPGMRRLAIAGRVYVGKDQIGLVRYFSDFGLQPLTNWWDGFGGAPDQVYVVQTNERIVERCLLLATDPGDLVLDPTCGSGTTATVAEQWGRRWITIDTSRVALALARARIMGARYPYYLLADSREGQQKEAAVTRSAPSTQPVQGNIRHGFVYERRAHITSSVVANNAEIDVIWEAFEARIAPLRAELSALLPPAWLADYRKTQRYTAPVPAEIQEWEVPRELPAAWPAAAAPLHARFWQERIARQQEIDASIAAKAEFEYLYDKPYDDKKKIRVAGPFTVESLSPHRTLGVDENDNLLDPLEARDRQGQYHAQQDFVLAMLEALRAAGVQQSSKEDRIRFTALTPWPGKYLCAEGTYLEGEVEKRAAVYMGPEFGTVQRADLVDAAREAGDANFDVLIACGFNFEAHTTEFSQLGRLPVLKARMNADLHMAEDLKNTGAGNLFMIFGEPDFRLEATNDGRYCVKILGVDVFDPAYGKVRSDSTDGIACWFLDTNYNGESFFVRHAYFLGANDPYNSLRTSLKAEINREAWETLYSDVSRPFAKPKTGRVAVKVINHLGDEVMKVFRLD